MVELVSLAVDYKHIEVAVVIVISEERGQISARMGDTRLSSNVWKGTVIIGEQVVPADFLSGQPAGDKEILIPIAVVVALGQDSERIVTAGSRVNVDWNNV